MSQEKVDVVRRGYEQSFAQRRVDDFRDLVTDDFRFHTRADFVGGQAEFTIEEVPQLWADLDETLTEYTLVPREYTDLGDQVLVTLDQSAQVRDSESRVQITIFHLWQFDGAKVSAGWSFATRAEALEAAGVAEET